MMLRIADLFCGAGGAAKGLHDAGFEVVGFDIKPQPHYPYEFHERDVMTMAPEELREFDAVWASPPCQFYSPLRWLPHSAVYEDSIPPTRTKLIRSGLPFVLENVMGAKLRAGWLCGRMFGLPFERHRAFETNFFWLSPGHPRCPGGNSALLRYRPTGKAFPVSLRDGARFWVRWAEAMGIDWMTRAELTQAVPPAYSEFLGKRLLEVLNQ